MYKPIAVLLLFCPVLMASKKAKSANYQDGVLLDFHMEKTGRGCSSYANTNGNLSANSNTYGNQTATTGNVTANTFGSQTCIDHSRALYSVAVSDHTYVLTPYVSPGKVLGAVGTLGISTLFSKNSDLYGQLPGSHVRVRSEDGSFYVKVGKRESRYSLVGAQ